MADISITASAVVPSATANIGRGTAGATIAAGQALYADSGDSNKLKLAANSSAATAAVVGIAVNSASAGQPVECITSGDLTVNSALVAAATVYVLGNSAGALSAADDLHSSSNTRYGTVVGISLSATVLRVGILASGVQNP